jgi:hypothetical protein
VLSSFIGGFLFGWLDRFEHDQPTRTVRPPTPQKISRKILYVIMAPRRRGRNKKPKRSLSLPSIWPSKKDQIGDCFVHVWLG